MVIYCPDNREADPTACNRETGVRNPGWQEDSDDEMETTFTTLKPCDEMDTASPMRESAGRPKDVGGPESFVNPLYETAGNVTGKLAMWSTPMVIKIKINDEWGGLTKKSSVSAFFDFSIETSCLLKGREISFDPLYHTSKDCN